jgi:hypothetical protein
MLKWLQPITALPEKVKIALSAVWDRLPYERQVAIQTDITTKAQEAAAMKENMKKELARKEEVASDLTNLVTKTEKSLNILQRDQSAKEEDSGTLSDIESMIDATNTSHQS